MLMSAPLSWERLYHQSQVRKNVSAMKRLHGVENLRNYPADNITQLEELLVSGVSALPDSKRKDFYDLRNHERTFFIHISSATGRVALLAAWLRANRAIALAV
jgi:hypothetical protein